MSNENNKRLQKKAISTKKRNSDKNKPKRPLSAYNIFFKEERLKLLTALNCKDKRKVVQIDAELNEEVTQRLQSKTGKISFEQLGKIIGQRWKNVESGRLKHCTMLAKADTERYQKEMNEYKETKKSLRYAVTSCAVRPHSSHYSRIYSNYYVQRAMHGYQTHSYEFQPQSYSLPTSYAYPSDFSQSYPPVHFQRDYLPFHTTYSSEYNYSYSGYSTTFQNDQHMFQNTQGKVSSSSMLDRRFNFH